MMKKINAFIAYFKVEVIIIMEKKLHLNILMTKIQEKILLIVTVKIIVDLK